MRVRYSMRVLKWVVAAGIGSAAAACGGSNPPPALTPTAQQSQEVVRPGDLISVKIFGETDLSDTVEVDPQGNVVLPKLGQLKLGGVEPGAVRSMITTGYAKYLVNPSIEVTVLRRVQVTGAVKTPNLYHVSGTMTVSDVIALAGGVTSVGNDKKVQLIRDGQTIAGNLSTETKLADTPLRSGDQLNVPYRSWVSRNPYVLGAAVSAVATIVAIIVGH